MRKNSAKVISADSGIGALLAGLLSGGGGDEDDAKEAEQAREQLSFLRDPDNAGKLGDIDEEEQRLLGVIYAYDFAEYCSKNEEHLMVRVVRIDIPVFDGPFEVLLPHGSKALEWGTVKPGHITMWAQQIDGVPSRQKVVFHGFTGDAPLPLKETFGPEPKWRHACTRMVDGTLVHLFGEDPRHV